MIEATGKYLLGLQRKKYSEGKKLHINAETSIIFFRMHRRYICDIIHMIALTWPQGLGITHSN